MTDYIKREDAVIRIAVLMAAEAESDGCEDIPMGNYIEYASEDLADIQSADVAPVRHGRWIDMNTATDNYYPRYRCSVCDYGANYSNFCPNCGAKMEGVEGND